MPWGIVAAPSSPTNSTRLAASLLAARSGLLSADVRDRVVDDLPAGIHLQPGELRIEFSGAEELSGKLFELSKAMVNDWGRFQEVVASSHSCS